MSNPERDDDRHLLSWRPIRGQHPGHVITVSQSEADTARVTHLIHLPGPLTRIVDFVREAFKCCSKSRGLNENKKRFQLSFCLA